MERERRGRDQHLSELFFVLRTKNYINFVRLVWRMGFAVGAWKCKQSFVGQFKTAGILVKQDGSIHGVTLDR